jgi:hypothetical protein
MNPIDADRPGDARPTVKVHGLFRSGTNLAKYLIAQRFDCEVSFHRGGHKHLPLPCIPGVTEHAWIPTVVCVKNPLANLVSLFEYARKVRFKHFDCGREWSEFLRQRLVIRMNGDPRWPAYRFANPIDYWNAFYANALSIPPQHLFVLNYEALLRDGAAVLGALDAAFPALPRRPADLELPGSVVAAGSDAQPAAALGEDEFARRGWYLDRTWLDRFDDEQLRFAAGRIDREVLAAAGYAPAELRRAARTGNAAGSTGA